MQHRSKLAAWTLALASCSGCASRDEAAPASQSTSVAAASPETEPAHPPTPRPSKEKAKGSGGTSPDPASPASTPPGLPPSTDEGRDEAEEKKPSPSSARPLAAVAEVSGGRVSRESLARMIADNVERFRDCATSDAKVDLRLTVSGGGSITAVEARSSQPDDARLRDCVRARLLELRLSRDVGSDTETVGFTLSLTRPAF